MMWQVKKKLVFMILVLGNISLLNCQEIDKPRGPWQLAFKVVGGSWNSSATGYSGFWELFTSTDTYNTASPVPDQRDFSTSSDHYKSELVQQWEDGYISVQAIKLSFFKNNEEKASVVFDAIGKTKTTWFKCDNILYSSYTDLPDNTLPTECPGKNAMGLPLTMMKVSYSFAYCHQTTGWLVVVDTDFSFSLCPSYMPADGSEPKPYFKYSTLTTVADLSTQLETADSIGIFFQVWDMAFKGVEGIKPAASGLNNLTGLFMLDITENDNSDLTVRNLQHSQSSQIFKSDVINLWGSYFIDMVKFSMLKSGVEQAYVVFDGTNTDKLSWFSESNILFSSYGSSLDEASLEMCSIEGDTYRNWQIQSLADYTGCTSSEQLGWMFVKEPKNNGTCSWDTSTIKKKPFFLYNTDTAAASPSTFQYADVIAVFVHGWRLVIKVAAGGSVSPKSGIYSLWSETGSMNVDVDDATSLSSGTTYKSSIIDQWTSFYIRAVKIAAYKDGLEVFYAVFDATGSTNTDWLDCARLLYTSVSGLTSTTANTNSYTCSLQGESSSFRFLLGKSADCGSMSATGVFCIVDTDSACSSRNDLPQFLFSNTFDTSLDDMTESQLADTFAVFVDMANCYTDTCLNGATCQDLGGNFRCFCAGSYYGDTCEDLDGTFGTWSSWDECSVTCANGTQSRNRTCLGTEGDGICVGENSETIACSLDPCPIDGGYTEWITWTQCTVTCGTGTRNRSRECINPVPQHGGSDCVDPASESENCSTNPCPIDGGLTEWTDWSACSVTCESGTQSRERTCTNPTPQYGGTNCTGETLETKPCNLGLCPIDGGYTEWSVWTACTVSCGGGEQSRARECTNPAPQYGGNQCSGNDNETQTCNNDNCPIDGGYSEWNEWTSCTATCGGGQQSRTRECTNPVPQYGGNQCSGNDNETQTCNNDNCPIDGGYSEWSEWEACTVSCGGGEQSRTRECTNPAPQYGGNQCPGNDNETQTCNNDNCPIDGGYSEWNEWTSCTVTCGGGQQSRTRECTNPAPQYGGNQCSGNNNETQTCNNDNCPIDGGYSEWSAWEACTVSCGGGEQSRTRECTNPAPQYGGNQCSGNDNETQTCNNDNCPIDGGYSEWNEWTSCTETCGGGQQSRTRECTNPAPQYGGNQCSGNNNETQTCNNDNCPIDGGYSEWNEWTACTVSCGGWEQIRTRECTNPAPQYGGNQCLGNANETQTCNNDNCPIDGGYSEWNEWTACTLTCGGGQQSRTRECTNPASQYGGNQCSGNDNETQTCNNDNCPIDGGYSEWSEWEACTVSCGGGEQSRTRECTNPTPQYGGNQCLGNDNETQTCNNDNCPIDGGYSEWSEWAACTVSCGGGEQSRTRECTNPVPQYGGNQCSGNDNETQTCNNDNCPIDGGYSEWSEWAACTVSCGGGEQSRTRECTNPTPQYGGNQCLGNDNETETCNNDNCPIDGGYSQWNEWTACTVPCGGGEQSRSRECTNPAPQYGGNQCLGNDNETQTCNNDNCPIDGGYSEWSEWEACTVSCGGGEQLRTRECTSPTPQYGGNYCSGNDNETQTCNNDTCPIDGGYSEWNEWTGCTVSCGGGEQSRTRECTNPTPQYGGNQCFGNDNETQTCNNDNCPIDGGYSEWNEWTTCTETCGGGEQSRSRQCTNPAPQYGGNGCFDNGNETQTCNNDNCPIDGGYSEWNEWTTCTVTCGGGEQSRTRECTNPAPQYGGNQCSGNDNETQTCNNDNCPIDGGYSEWSDWTVCSVSCGGGEESRTRECTNPTPQYGGNQCLGNDNETQTCNNDNCPIDGGYSEWNEWTACTLTCGGGEQSRTRECTNPAPQYGGNQCSGNDNETQICNNDSCPIDGGYSEWNEWTACIVSCGGGEQSRTRECTNPAPQYGGNQCLGNNNETQTCNNGNCPIDGGYSEWDEWTVCTVTCGGGEQSRSRECTNPAPQYGGNQCSGNDNETQTCNNDNCPIDGGYSEWNEWTACTVSCGGGEQSRTRECTNPAPQYGGNQCSGNDNETQTCNNDNCPIDGGYSEWNEWTACTLTCGGGEQSRTRECTNPVPQYGGNQCSGNDNETQTCNNDNCPIDGGYSEWSEWAACTVSCGGGEQSRTRECTNPTPQYGGNQCLGNDNETETCNNDNCPIDGGYSQWNEWTACTVPCGGGEQSRSRECTNPAPQYGGNQCLGNDNETQTCNNDNCPIDGGYSEWSEWEACTVSCGGGEQLRTRECTSPTPQYGGNYCSGNDNETQTCNNDTCPIDGGYSEWNEWTGCTVSCGGGEQSRTRECTNPTPQYGGNQCFGNDNETQTCNNDNCPIDGGYSEWNEWTTCTETCGGGEQSRSRQCTNPAPQYGGNGCFDNGNETQTCNNDNCPIDGGYSEWNEWTTCTVTCGGGEQSRTRECTNPAPQYGGNQCSGNDNETQTCNNDNCPIDGGYSEWSDWTVCSVSCGGGEESRTRECTNPTPQYGGNQCLGNDNETQTCNNDNCPIDGGYSEWNEWTACTLTCGGGEQSRTRECTNPAPQYGGNQCSGNDNETQICNNDSCPIDGGYSEWNEWTACIVSCGGGEQSRTRECTNPAPQYGGNQCLGNNNETQTCNNGNCPIDGGYSEWDEWTVCTVTCGGGEQSRSRECTNPAPQYGGNQCSGNDNETQTCNNDNCPIDGGYSEWNEWTACTVSCGGGEQSRTRECTNPAPQYGGNQCSGNDNETQTCNNDNCPIDGGYSEWNEWTACTLTCGGGEQSRTRECTNPAPQYGGNQCSGNDNETQICNNDNCTIDGGYSEWNEWTACTVSCGGGEQSRTRECTNPAPQYGGNQCSDSDSETQTCNNDNCPIDGGYSEWNEWTACTVSCGGGEQSRTRQCTNPAPQYGGNQCSGNDNETQLCNNDNCPIDGGYSEWNKWTACTLTCGGGEQSRTRECTNPAPQYGGNQCSGNDNETQTCNNDICPIDGGYSEWNEWTACTVSCGGGEQSRTRECTNPAPQYGGNQCLGNDNETQTCNNDNCPIDGGYSEWNEWTTCTVTYGGGEQSRTRECTNPAPQYGGNQCSGNDNETQICNNDYCPIDGGYSEWNEWTVCTVSCGGGYQSRTRECTNPTPQYGGNQCFGNDNETQTCNNDNCPIDGGYSEWSEWAACTVSCGGGEQSRTRECTNPAPQYGGNQCFGNDNETQTCNNDNCPIDGGYSEWSEWAACTVPCGGGEQSRSRECTNPAPQYGGNQCSGNENETQTCNYDNCVIDGGYSEWIEWTACTVSCGGGEQSRSRECTNPAPQYGGNQCSGNDNETQTCNNDICPIDGGYSEWSEWTACTVSCGEGKQLRSRECTNPAPQYGGNQCSGNDSETQTCNNDNCPIDGGYSAWSDWTVCTVTCGGGEQLRSRGCTNPAPQYGGNECFGNDTETQTCNNDNCPIDGGYSKWSEWDKCTVSCGGGEQSRLRACTNPTPQYGGNQCSGNDSETQICNNDNCPIDGGYSEWNEWTACTVTCGDGEQLRSRECTNPTPQYGGNECFGNDTETQTCNNDNCPIDGGYTEWSVWTACTVSCGSGEQLRSRECTNPAPQYGGNQCSGNNSETEICNIDNCPIAGGYTEWSVWTGCTVTCGGGEQLRSRECKNPAPQYGGNQCSGNDSETQICNNDNCPIDGGYTEWNEWTACTVTCGGGEQSRSRACSNPTPQYGGNPCSGDDSETQSCNSDNCPIDGGYTEWSVWTACSVTCGGGDQSRSRECTNPTPQYGGQSCPGDDTETFVCGEENCPVNGGFSEWTSWETCSKTCGSGQQTRSRDCSNPSPQYGGNDCIGDDVEVKECNVDLCPDELGFSLWSDWTSCTKSCDSGIRARARQCLDPNIGCIGSTIDTGICNTQSCPIDGGYTAWTEWSTCSVTCGDGERTRSRECTNPSPQHGGAPCDGLAVETLVCTEGCPSLRRAAPSVDGGFTEWSVWSECSVTCGDGDQTRNRTCTNPEPQNGGIDCVGDTDESQTCNMASCPPEIIDGGFTEWTTWTDCSVSCDGGEQTRSRTCTNPEPQNGGSDCVGATEESQTCNTASCPPVDGGYTEWSSWTECSVTCGDGEQTRTRACISPEPQFGGNGCVGDAEGSQSCNLANCPVDGGFSEWGAWSECSKTCETGEKTRSRECNNPVPEYDGSDCIGNTTETVDCNTDHCPGAEGFSSWSAWGTCTVSCGTGTTTRTRVCENSGNGCIGDLEETEDCSTQPCPVNGGFTEWSSWGDCSDTCGNGTQTRTRNCSNPEPLNGGDDCVGDAKETEICNFDPCPVDGGFTEWSAWSECSVSCGDGDQTRSRTCTNPEPQNGGIDCVGDTEESQTCNMASCSPEIIDGGFTEWTIWTDCPVSCGGGEQTRSRTCTNPEPQNGGSDCVGATEESQTCNTASCPPVDGGYTEWSSWTECSVTCGAGEQTRTRACTSPEPQFGGNGCVGDAQESQSCNLANCPVDGGFSEWGVWSECSKTCETGEKTRSRECNNPVPEYGGSDCIGNTTDTVDCNTDPCPGAEGFSSWSAWDTCTVSCGTGTTTRTRLCENSGDGCIGDLEETKDCNTQPCPVNGGFTDWGAWGDCSVTCGNGTHTRTRNCSNPEPQNGGDDCMGEAEETEICNVDPCPVDGYWSIWEEWSTCSVSCASGTRERTRTCVEPLNGGNPCVGAAQQVEFCNTQACPLDGFWSEWTAWGDCNATCEGGVSIRTRTCIGPMHGGENCSGISQESEICNGDPCPIDGYWIDWNEWTTCTVTCNTGTRERRRTCIDAQYGGKECTGAAAQTEFCNTELCPVDGNWLDWSEWSTCNATCGGGARNRSRTCVEPMHGGQDCIGEDTETDVCNEDPCPVDGFWLNWLSWGACSVSCSDGTRNRSRLCLGPLYGGLECVGESSESDNCNNGNCPIDGYWSEWSEWTKCSETCGGGYRNKSRTCNEPLYGGLMCQGELSETDTCNVDACPIDGEWSDWTQWSTCTDTCGGGTRVKTRTCSEPKYGGKFCEGEASETNMCNVEPCPVDGYWEEWSEWTECTVTCAGGSRDRTRACVEPRFGGKACIGTADAETEECNAQKCPVDGVWITWSQWSECSSTCNGGARNRSRSCIEPMFGGKSCDGRDIDIQICGLEVCPSVDGGWSAWTGWTACSMTCGFAERTRNRTCTNPSPQWGGRYCEGIHIQSDSCKENDCPVDGEWTEWTAWTTCFNMTAKGVLNPTCGRGFKGRNRSCDNPAPQFEGSDCAGDSVEITTCNIPCHVITCSKEHPEQCQIIFQNIPENKGLMVSTSASVVLFILLNTIRLYL